MASSTSNTALTVNSLSLNASSSDYGLASTLSTHGWTVLADDLSKLVIQ